MEGSVNAVYHFACQPSHQPRAGSGAKGSDGESHRAGAGKSEEYLLLGFEDNCRLWLRGDDSEPIAYIEANIFGNEEHLGYDAFTAEATMMFHEVLDVAPENVYINYTDIPDWGAGGRNFDRNRFR